MPNVPFHVGPPFLLSLLTLLTAAVAVSSADGSDVGSGADRGSNTAIAAQHGTAFVRVAAGSFLMGTWGSTGTGNTGTELGQDPGQDPGAANRSDETLHRVTITRHFYMSRHEVTQAEYVRIVGDNPSAFKGDDLPVENVTWYEAVAYCNALSRREGREPCYSVQEDRVICDFEANGYRLPTEAEWEYAARGGDTQKTGDAPNGGGSGDGGAADQGADDASSGDGSGEDGAPGQTAEDPPNGTGHLYAGGNDIDQLGWYAGNSGNRTRPVGRKEPNDLGIFDMTGNVSEWCWDWYAAYPTEDATDPSGPDFGAARVERGGGWYAAPEFCRVSNRNRTHPRGRSAGLGFRVVRTVTAGEGRVVTTRHLNLPTSLLMVAPPNRYWATH